MAAGRYAKKQQAESQATPHGKCCAEGCPLTGDSGRRTLGKGRWYCRFHAAADAEDFGLITQRINRYRDYITHAAMVRKAGPVLCAVDPGKYYNTSNAATRKSPGEHWHDYEKRLSRLVESLILRGTEN